MLHQHKMKMVEEDNTAAATDLFSKYTEEKSTLRADFHSLQGENAVKAHQEYMKKLNEMRLKYEKMAPNLHVRKTFNVQSRTAHSNEINVAATHVAGQRRA